MRTGAFAGHECTSSPTRSEVNMAADVLRHVVPNSPPDECMVKVPTGGRVKLQHHARQGSKTVADPGGSKDPPLGPTSYE